MSHKDAAPLDPSVIETMTGRNSTEITLYTLFNALNDQASQSLMLLNKVKQRAETDQNFIKRFFSDHQANEQLTKQINAFRVLHNQLQTLFADNDGNNQQVLPKIEQSLVALTHALQQIMATSTQPERLTALNNAVQLLTGLQAPEDNTEWFSLPKTPLSPPEKQIQANLPVMEEGEPPAYAQLQLPTSQVRSRRKRSAVFAEAPLHIDNNPTLAATDSSLPDRTGATACYADGNVDPADLAPTPEVQITDEIRQLAKQLDYSPVKIFEFVSNKIKFELYQGSIKGAQTTLWSQAGNDIDQASLLITLLRASNIPAHYVRGRVYLEDKPAHRSWFKLDSEVFSA